MGHFYGSQVHRSDLRLLIALFRAMLPLTVGGSITWLEPPPFETVTDTSRIYSTTKQVMQGSLNEELSWNFSLTADSSIAAVLLKFRGQPAVTLVPNQSPSVEPVFAEHFNVVWVPNKLTLILFNVTDAEKGEYCCEVVTMGMSSRSWMRKIQLLVLAPSPKVSSITDAQNPIQTTVSAFTASEGLIRTTESSLTASEADVPWGIIGAVVGAVDVAIAIVIGIAIVRFLKRRKHSQRSAGIPMQAPVSCALLEPLAADGINCNHSKMDIQEKKEDPSV